MMNKNSLFQRTVLSCPAILAVLVHITGCVVAPDLVPWPKSIEIGSQYLTLSRNNRITAEDASLVPLSSLLSDEIFKIAGLRLNTAEVRGKSGDIILKIDHKLDGEAYRLDVTDRVVVAGGNYRAVAWGTVSALQAIRHDNKRVFLPCMRIEDEPFADFRGLLLDVARKWHSIETIEQIVEMCRLYKIKYLQLHLTDNPSFTFPSRAYPQLTTVNRHGGRSYTWDELQGLEQFATERGVTIIPEFEVPGHGAAMNRAMPELFKIKGTQPYEHHASINFANKEVLKAIETIVAEMCEVFKSSPYFHIGGDEADLAYAHQHPDFKAAFEKHDLGEKGQWQLYRYFLIQMNEIVRRQGKQMIVWEGFHRDPSSKFQIPKDVIVMEYECPFYPPKQLVEDGYTMVNAAWTPLYVVKKHKWSAEKIYDWNMYLFGQFSRNYELTQWRQLEPTNNVIGAQMCAWEQVEAAEVGSLRAGLPAMSERIWAPDLQRGYENFERRLKSVDGALEKLVHAVTFEVEGLVRPDRGRFEANIFNDTLIVTMKTNLENVEIRYTLNGRTPTADSRLYIGPVTLRDTCVVRAAAFDEEGKSRGYMTGDVFYHEEKPMANLAMGKPVSDSGGTQGLQKPDYAVDGWADIKSVSWWAAPWPQWLQVDLEKVYEIDRVKVYPYWDGARYYQYTVEASIDGKEWWIVCDKSNNTHPAGPEGDEFLFKPRRARYVRLNVLKNSDNEGVHIVELQVFEAEARRAK